MRLDRDNCVPQCRGLCQLFCPLPLCFADEPGGKQSEAGDRLKNETAQPARECGR